MDIWELLRESRLQEATMVAEDNASRDETSLGDAINFAVCLLLGRNWKRAYEHFCHFTEIYPWTVDTAFKFAGVAKWCDGDRKAAVAEWKQGIDVDYSDTGGGITIPLHLYFAAAVEPDLLSMDDVIELLHSRLQAKPHDGWPGYLAKLLLGEITSEMAIKQSKGDSSHLWGEERRQAEESSKQQIDFWWGVKSLKMGDASGFVSAMKHYSELSWADFDTNRELLVYKVRSTEFYLARSEAERSSHVAFC